ncbi:MAG: hypothetical protein ACPGRT_02865 [Flavobacteriaceae bacterium]
MEKFRYGPLIYITQGMDEDEGNYFWNGNPPVAYDSSGVPIDSDGMQCLDVTSVLHPAYKPTDTFYSEVLGVDIPTITSFQKWFDDNFFIVSEKQIKKYIIKWWMLNYQRSPIYTKILNSYSSVEEIQEAVWPDETTS